MLNLKLSLTVYATIRKATRARAPRAAKGGRVATGRPTTVMTAARRPWCGGKRRELGNPAGGGPAAWGGRHAAIGVGRGTDLARACRPVGGETDAPSCPCLRRSHVQSRTNADARGRAFFGHGPDMNATTPPTDVCSVHMSLIYLLNMVAGTGFEPVTFRL